ncbi:nucleotide exchange factor GrpE [Buchnera aphidicola (Periphyllus koelreuteriae)]|uniref:nucleotide exchange factor GrpE n=1 Tax=Buchnera aphidicola TaxID=9 RepID=UPI0031B823C7
MNLSKNKKNIKEKEKKKKNIMNQLNKIKILKEKIDEKKKQIKELPLRFFATIENIKKNTKNQCLLIKKDKKIEFFKKIFLIIDKLEKIIKNILNLKDKNNPKLQGISLIYQSLLDVIKKNNIQIEGIIGEEYNKNIHQLKNKQKIKKHSKIKKIFKKGYSINKKIIRKVLVKI